MATATCRESEITQVLNELSQTVSRLQKAREKLHSRLQRVTRNPDNCKNENAPDTSYACQLATDIKEQQRRLFETTVGLEDIVTCLEI